MSKAAHIPPAKAAKILEAYLAGGETIAAIAARFKVSPSVVSGIRVRAGIEPKRKPHNKVDPQIAREIVKAYKANEPVADIGARYGISGSYVCDVVRRHGIERRRPIDRLLKRNEESMQRASERRKAALDMFLCGLSIGAIADHLGVTHGRADQIVRDAHVEAGIRRTRKSTWKLTEAEKAEAIRLYRNDTLSVKDIAHRFAVSEHWLHEYLRRRGITPHRREALLAETREKIERGLRLVRLGTPINVAAARVGVSQVTLHRHHKERARGQTAHPDHRTASRQAAAE